MKFSELNFKPFILEALKELKFVEATTVQEKVFEQLKSNSNIIVQSATGSGKTHAFLLPIFNQINENDKTVQAVIIAPTRELATQLFNCANQIAKFNDIDVRLYIGGANRDDEIRKLNISQPQVVIGTIGRIHDLAINQNVLKIYSAKNLVIDEADMVFEEKEIVEVDKVLGIIVDNPKFWLFSATLTKGLRNFINKYLTGTEEIILEEKELTKSSIEHIFIPCKAKQKEQVLMEVLDIINPYLALIFVNTKEKVIALSKFLADNNIKVATLHGNLDDRTRRQTLKRIQDMQYKYIVASDIASRGIDLPGVSHVINFELPTDIEFYIHRTGRTARYDAKGSAIALYDYDDEKYVEFLRKKGLNVKFKKIVNKELVQTKLEKARGTIIIKQKTDAVHAKYPMPKKVKPGYKKKRLEKIKKEIKKIERERIENIYRNKNKKK
ncbi:MAG: DEAD/DEAH box helicase [Bacilli bacterium]|nr:DEAD/DEAH box helicase [Bacilli bacterium]